MKYQVPIYKLEKENIVKLGNIVVEKNSLGVYDINSGNKIRVTSGLVNIYEVIKENNVFVKNSDFNGSNLVVSEKTEKENNKNKNFNHNKSVKEYKKENHIKKYGYCSQKIKVYEKVK